ncbi:MAG: GAF domain-containing protein [Saprospiraceae bacterium]|nr:GAF domain-containing protein [Saprospiraceae bacterium]
MPVIDSDILPMSVIQYAWRTQEQVTIINAIEDPKYMHDPYIVNHKVLSSICIPVTNKGNRIGLIYLENNLIEGIFSPRRMEILNMLTGQIGIALENALLYENLEEKVKERTSELETQKKFADDERKKSDDLLLNILPLEIANELKKNGTSEARLFNDVTVMFTDFVNFTKISESLSPKALVEELNHCFELLTTSIAANGLEKIKTIGDAYLAVCGLPSTKSIIMQIKLSELP